MLRDISNVNFIVRTGRRALQLLLRDIEPNVTTPRRPFVGRQCRLATRPDIKNRDLVSQTRPNALIERLAPVDAIAVGECFADGQSRDTHPTDPTCNASSEERVLP